MTDRTEDRIASIFAEAIARPAALRAAFIDEACADDEALALRVRRLVHSHGRARAVLPEPDALDLSSHAASMLDALDANDLDDEAPSRLIGQTIDGFRILRLLGAGGMGAVYEAQQDRPARTIALKLMRPGMISRSLLRRFEFEAEVLGRLRHPGIAQIHQTGTYDDGTGGVPYFAMEYVPGARTILQFADEQGLKTPARLELFAQVCDAVHHGHQRGVIHRDLKPANLLVDAEGQVKVIDFGVARATDADLAATMHTRTGELVGTMHYMSPEQIDGDAGNLDTRTDVYSLGVILYELLTGRWPYDTRSRSLAETVRQIQESLPVRIGNERREFRGDIQAILDVALAKDPNRRYPSAAELAGDIRRHLRREPIGAAPPTLRYRAGRFVRRNPVVVSAAVVVVLSLVAGLSVATWAWLDARDANLRTAVESDRRQRALDFVTGLLRTPAPGQAGADARIVDALREAETVLERSFADDPALEGSIRAVLGEVLFGLGLYLDAERHYRRAVALTGTLPGVDDVEIAALKGSLGVAVSRVGRLDEAVEILEDAIAIRAEAPMPFGDDQALLMSQLAAIYDLQQRFDDAEELHQRVLDQSGPDSLARMQSLAGLGVAAYRRNNLSEALEYSEKAFDLAVSLNGMAHPDTIALINNIVHFRSELGDPEGAIRTCLEVLEPARAQLGERHPLVAQLMVNLGDAYRSQGHLADARTAYEESISIRAARFGDDHILVAEARYKLALVLQSLDMVKSAEALRKMVDPYRRHYGDDSWEHLLLTLNLARTLGNLREHQEAEEWFRRAYEGMRRSNQALEQNHFLGDYLEARFRSHTFDRETERLCHELKRLAGARRTTASQSPSHPVKHLFVVLYRQQRFDEAIAEADAALAVLDPLGDEHTYWRINRGMAQLDGGMGEMDLLDGLQCDDALLRSRWLGFRGSSRLAAGDATGAETLLRAALETRSPDHSLHVVPSLGRIETDLGRALVELGRPDEAAQLLRDGHAHLVAAWGEDDWCTVMAQGRLASLIAGD